MFQSLQAMQEPLISASSDNIHDGSELLLMEEAKNQQIQREMAAKEVAQAEDTPAYATLQAYGLLDNSYRKEHFDDIFTPGLDLSPNSSRADTWNKRLKWGVVWTPGCGFMLYVSLHTLRVCEKLYERVLCSHYFKANST